MVGDSWPVSRALEELHLIQCSLLPGEVLSFLDDEIFWHRLLEKYPAASDECAASTNVDANISIVRFQLKVRDANVWFQVEMPLTSTTLDGPAIHVKGQDISRAQQEAWQRLIEDKLVEVAETEFQTFQILSLHLLPLLHENHSQRTLQSQPSETKTQEYYHALFTSHHLVAPGKRRSLQKWALALSLTGFAKVGHPGVIYAQGTREHIEEFVSNVKALPWLALKLRFSERLESLDMHGIMPPSTWREFSKVGQVVEEMRTIGKEEYVLQVGIGSAG